MRLFVSIDVPERLRGVLADVQAELAGVADLRTSDPGQAHLTLQFLGDVDESRVGEVERELERAVAEAGVGPFEMVLGDVGVFPSLDYISVVWVGVREGASEAESLNAAVEARLAELGFEGDDHAFTPHVTIGRMDGARGKDRVREFVTERAPDVGRFRVSDVRLMESELTDEGPEYRTVRAVPLEGTR